MLNIAEWKQRLISLKSLIEGLLAFCSFRPSQHPFVEVKFVLQGKTRRPNAAKPCLLVEIFKFVFRVVSWLLSWIRIWAFTLASLSKINILRSPQRSPLTRSSLPVHTFHNNSLISDQVQVQHWADECLESKVGQECQQAPRDTWSGLHSRSNQLVASQSHPHKGLFH